MQKKQSGAIDPERIDLVKNEMAPINWHFFKEKSLITPYCSTIEHRGKTPASFADGLLIIEGLREEEFVTFPVCLKCANKLFVSLSRSNDRVDPIERSDLSRSSPDGP